MNIILFEGECFFPRSDERYSHIVKILRKNVGDSFSAGIVNGPTGRAVIADVSDAGLRFSFEPENPPEPLFPVWLLVGFPRPIQLKRLLRSVSSMGAAGILLAGTDFGEKSYRESGIFGRGTAAAALRDGAMQSGFSSVCEMHVRDSVENALRFVEKRFPSSRRVIFDMESRGIPFRSREIEGVGASSPLFLAVGSERGWSEREREMFASAGWQARHLGKRIMRTETAAVAGLAAALSFCGFWD